MKASQQTIQQIEHALRKVISCFPADANPTLTDIHIEVCPDSGEIHMYDDDDRELSRCVVEEWISSLLSPEEAEEISPILRQCIGQIRTEVDTMSIIRPYSFVLVDEEHETIQELVVIDDEDTILLDNDLLKGLEEDLDDFLQKLLSE